MVEHKNNKNKTEPAEVSKAREEKTVILKEEEYKTLLEEVSSAKEGKDRLLRLQAEFENAKKRLEKDRLEFIKFANEGLIMELLGILDDLERSVEAAMQKHEDYEAFLKGVEMILAHIYDLLKKNQVQAIKTKGEKFDPHFHEALLQIETNDHPDGAIVEELQKGYIMDGKVIRTAKVKVAKQKVEGEK